MKYRRLFVVINSIALLGTLTANALANILPFNGVTTGEVSDGIENLFVPSGTTFAIWGVIYTLLVVLVIYQWVTIKRTESEEQPVQSLHLWFLLSCAANALWIILWHWQYLVWSLVVMLILLVSLIVMYVRSRVHDASLDYRVCIMLPISVYLGWITVATIANVTALLVVMEWNQFGLSAVIWTVIVMIAAILINVLAVILSGDIWFALVGVWALYGIFVKQSNSGLAYVQPIVYTALAGMAIIVVAILIHLVIKGKKVARGEA
jgi:hypothetical protein